MRSRLHYLSSLAFSMLVLGVAAEAQTTWFVAPGAAPRSPSNPGTDPLTPIPLQEALSNTVSVSGDTIHMAGGVYGAPTGGFSIQGKSLTIVGNGSTLDGNPTGTGTFSRHVLVLDQADVHIDSVTLKNGRAINPGFPNTDLKRTGGGLHLVDSAIFFEGACEISACQAELAGGGIFAQNSLIEANRLRVLDNSVLGGGAADPNGPPRGGGLALQQSTFRAKFVEFSRNSAGAVTNGAAPVWTPALDCIGGGIFCRQSDITLYNGKFFNNAASHFGGALFLESTNTAADIASATRFVNCTFTWNIAGSQFPGGPSPNNEWPGLGGAAFLANSETSAAFVRWNNCSFEWNYCPGDAPLFANESSTINAQMTPGGIPVLSVMTNSNIVFNTVYPMTATQTLSTYLVGRHKLSSCAVPFVAAGNGNINNVGSNPPACPAVASLTYGANPYYPYTYFAGYLVDAGNKALLPLDYLDLDDDLITQEPLPVDGSSTIAPNGFARMVSVCSPSTPAVDIGALEQ